MDAATLVAANINLDNYSRKTEFAKTVLPYVIKDVGGMKIAFIGIVTYEYIYDSFFQPVKITSPQDVVQNLAAKLDTDRMRESLLELLFEEISQQTRFTGGCVADDDELR